MVPEKKTLQGRMRGIAAEDRLAMRTIKTDGCWLFGTPGNGYGKLQIEGRTVAAHRYAYEVAHGAIPDGAVVRHSCDTPRCVRPDHLSLGSPMDNSRDMTRRARQARGVRQGSVKLTDAQVLELRELRRAGVTYRTLAHKFAISPSQASSVATGHDWGHLPGAIPAQTIRKIGAAEKAEALAHIAAGSTHAEIAEKFGVTRSAISQMVYRNRKKV